MLHVVTIRCNLLKESVKELFVRPLIIPTGDQLQFLTVISTFEVAHSADRTGQDKTGEDVQQHVPRRNSSISILQSLARLRVTDEKEWLSIKS